MESYPPLFNSTTDEMLAHVSVPDAMMMSVMKVQQASFNNDYGDRIEVKEFFAQHRFGHQRRVIEMHNSLK